MMSPACAAGRAPRHAPDPLRPGAGLAAEPAVSQPPAGL